MPMTRLEKKLAADVRELGSSGRAKGAETVFTGILAPDGGKGPRYVLAGEGGWPYLRMNSNSYPRFHGRQAAMIFSSADHTPADIDAALGVLAAFAENETGGGV